MRRLPATGCGRADGWRCFRVGRCGPGGTHGIDNVPETLDAKACLVGAMAVCAAFFLRAQLMTVPQEYALAQQRFDALTGRIDGPAGSDHPASGVHGSLWFSAGLPSTPRRRSNADVRRCFACDRFGHVRCGLETDGRKAAICRSCRVMTTRSAGVRRRSQSGARPARTGSSHRSSGHDADKSAFNAALARLPDQAAAFWE